MFREIFGVLSRSFEIKRKVDSGLPAHIPLSQVPWPSPYGAVIGDVCGSIYEHHNFKTDNPKEINLINDRCYFTDDTVLTAAIAEASAGCFTLVPGGSHYIDMKESSPKPDYGHKLREWGNKYPHAGYGARFKSWLKDPINGPSNSYGNGAAMRISPICWNFWKAFVIYNQDICYNSAMSEEDWGQRYHDLLISQVVAATSPTHNHPESILGATSVCKAINYAYSFGGRKPTNDKQGPSDTPAVKNTQMRQAFEDNIEYDISKTLAEIRPNYKFDVTCRGTVPVAIIAFLESHDFVSAIQNAISVGGDSDTIAAVTGSIAGAYYAHIPKDLTDFVRRKLPNDIKTALGVFGPFSNKDTYQKRLEEEEFLCRTAQPLKEY